MSYRADKLKTFDFEVKFDLEGRGQSPPKTIGILTKVFYTYGPNLVILAWMGDELSRRQASNYRTDGRTDGRTDAGNDNTRRPKLAWGKNHKVAMKSSKLTDFVALLINSQWLFHHKIQEWCHQYGSGHETAAVLLPGFAINW